MVLDRDVLCAVRKYRYLMWVLLSFDRFFITPAPKNPGREEGSVWRGWEGSAVWPEEVVEGTSACPFPSSNSAVVPGLDVFASVSLIQNISFTWLDRSNFVC